MHSTAPKFLLLCLRMSACLITLLALPAAILAQQRVIVTYADAFLSINDTQIIVTLPAPAPPAGVKVFELTDPALNINQASGDLEDSVPTIGSCERDTTVSIDQGTVAPDDKLDCPRLGMGHHERRRRHH